jgi:hypothetical protein
MSLIGGFRYSAPSGGATQDDTVVTFSGFVPSGLSDANIIGCALYVYSSNQWVPLQAGWLK